MRLNPPKIALTSLLGAVLLLCLTAAAVAAPPWPDAPAGWWLESYGVTEAEVATVADGYPDGSFKPGNAVTRGQFAKMAVSGLAVQPLSPTTPTFADVGIGNIFYAFIEGAYYAYLVGGYEVAGGRLEYRPNNDISRQQTTSILARYLSQIEIAEFGGIRGDIGLYGSVETWASVEAEFYLYEDRFSDLGQVASEHRANTAYLVYRGIVQGSNGMLLPNISLPRSQAAVLVLRVAAKAAELSMRPPAPTGLSVVETGGKVVDETALGAYVGNDPNPQVRGTAMVGRPVALYDTFGGGTSKLTESAANGAGIFYADLTSPLVDGLHRFTAQVTNVIGQVSLPSSPVEYLLDTVAPDGSITAPVVLAGQPDAAVNSPKPEFTVTAEDDRSGVGKVVFQYSTAAEPGAWISISTAWTPLSAESTVYTAVWGTTSLADGQYLFRAVITDAAGNARILDAVDVTVDTAAPAAQIAPGSLQPEPGWGDVFYTEERTPLFGGLGLDEVGAGASVGAAPSGVVKVEFLYAPADAAPTDWTGFSLLSWDMGTSGFALYDAPGIPPGGLPDGRYLFAVRATDRAGNQSPLVTVAGDPIAYEENVVRQVVIDNAAPVLALTTPEEGELICDNAAYEITWTLEDLSMPHAVSIEYSLDGGATWLVIDEEATFESSPGSYLWALPDVTGDKTECVVRITAVDMAGVALGKDDEGEGHFSQALSGVLTICDSPAAPTDVLGSDPDDEAAGVDWRDFGAVWTVSPSLGIVKQEVYLLPADAPLDIAEPDPAHTPVSIFNDRITGTWVSTESVITDSRGENLGEGEYTIWIVVTDAAGRTAQAASANFVVAAP